jgi:hypothetical protein
MVSSELLKINRYFAFFYQTPQGALKYYKFGMLNTTWAALGGQMLREKCFNPENNIPTKKVQKLRNQTSVCEVTGGERNRTHLYHVWDSASLFLATRFTPQSKKICQPVDKVGYATSSRQLNLENRMVFDNFSAWKGPKGDVLFPCS